MNIASKVLQINQRYLELKKYCVYSGRRDFELAHPGHDKRAASCISDCSQVKSEPYCAGGTEYSSICEMYNAVCTKGISPGSKGKCGMNCRECTLGARNSVIRYKLLI